MAAKKDDKKKDPPKAAKKADPPKKATPAPAAKKVEAAAKKPEPKASKAAVKKTPNIKPGTAPTAKQKALANVAGAAGKAAGVTGGGTTPARTQTVQASTVKPATKPPPATTTPPAGTKPGTTTTSSSGVPRSTTVKAEEVKGKPGNKPISNYRKEIKKDKKFDKKVEKAKEYVRQAATRPVTGMAGPGQDTRKAMALIAKARIKNRQEAMDDRAGAAAQKLVRSKMTPEEKKADKLLLRGKDPNASWKDINKAREAAGKDRLKGSVIRERKHETMDTRTAKGLDPKTGKPPVVKPTTPTTPVKPTTPTTPVKPVTPVTPVKPVTPVTPVTPTAPKPPVAPPPTTTAAPKTDNWVDAARK